MLPRGVKFCYITKKQNFGDSASEWCKVVKIVQNIKDKCTQYLVHYFTIFSIILLNIWYIF